jgi:hypothetical protein
MPTTEEVLNGWYKRVCATQNAHYQSANHFAFLGRCFGVPVIVLSVFVGSSVFANLEKKPDIQYQIFVGLCSIAAAVLAGLQTYFGYAERAEKHRVAGAKYGGLGRELEVLRSSLPENSKEVISNLLKRLEALALESPNNSAKIYDRAKKSLGFT